MNNLKFNRIEKNGNHKYLKDFQGIRKFGDVEYAGFIKCKLVHNKYYSIVIPDQIFLDIGEKLYWIQPFYFIGNIISYFGEGGNCTISVDISHGVCIRIEFKTNSLISKLEDGSFLYKCTIKGIKYLYRYITGPAKIINKIPFIKLYHHTTRKSKKGILESNEFWSTNWNIRGTKKTKNISYLYLTALPEILCLDDLGEIAMSSNGKLTFRLDQNNSNIPDLFLDVYRESTTNRRESLSFWVDSTFLATQSSFRHTVNFGAVYHEIVCPFVHRIGVEAGTTVKIRGKRLLPNSPKTFNYAIVGDATFHSGLIAPFDEENTTEILKIELIDEPLEIIGFWKKNENSNQYDNKNIEEAEFEKSN